MSDSDQASPPVESSFDRSRNVGASFCPRDDLRRVSEQGVAHFLGQLLRLLCSEDHAAPKGATLGSEPLDDRR